MPVWHERTRTYVDDGKLVLLGIAQEQHPERCQLFAQWQQLDWPILHDPINVLQSRAVPMVWAIDEHGIIRLENPRPEQIGPEFVDREFSDDASNEPAASCTPTYAPDFTALRRRAIDSGTAADWQRLADALTLWAADDQLDAAIKAYQQAVAIDATQATAWFRLGVCLRMQYERPPHRVDDFRDAVVAWGKALDLDPGQYIWRRRIQQYGPRLDKPYPFYDWVEAAEAAILARGETPIELPVRPDGAELAAPIRNFESASAVPPGREDAIERDDRAARIEVVVVPDRIEPGRSARVHLVLRLNEDSPEQWDLEAGQIQVRLQPPESILISEPFMAGATGPSARSLTDPVSVGYEIKVPTEVGSEVRVPGYALYNLCNKDDGRCRFVRQDFEIVLLIRAR